jgi:4-hydroxy-2-oxoheptanedioate aldolase
MRLDLAVKQAGGRPLLGVAAYTYHPPFVEITGHMGFDVLWIEMEHAPLSLGEAADLCRIAQGVGLMTMIRISDARRDTVLRAAECGPDILDLPMVNSAAVAEQLVEHARYAPLGKRGFFGCSRAVKYGMAPNLAAAQQEVNRQLCLMAQIETCEAIEAVDAICSVAGLDAVFLGPGDLSASLGLCGETEHPTVVAAMQQAIHAARLHGKLAALACRPSECGKWAAEGAQLLFVGSDIAAVRVGLQSMVDQTKIAVESTLARVENGL